MAACPKPKTIRDPYYMAFVRYLDCCSCGKYRPNDPQHAGIGGQSIKADDTSCIPLCRNCHRAFECNFGKFKDFDKMAKREANEKWITETHERFREALHECNGCGELVNLLATEGRRRGTWTGGKIVCVACQSEGPEWDKERHLESQGRVTFGLKAGSLPEPEWDE